MHPKKINILEYEGLPKEYYNSVVPHLSGLKVPIFKSKVLSLLELNNDSYWGELRSVHNVDIAMLDHNHWNYNDRVFASYVEKISSVQFPAVCLFDSPLGYEMPKMDPHIFVNKLSKRTEILANTIRRRHKNTIILSPSIGILDASLINLYIGYFIRNRQHFDAYSIHCCNPSDEHSIGILTHLISQIMKISPKELWITKWAVPSFEGKVVSSKFLGPSLWSPDNYAVASQRLRRMFSLIEMSASRGSKWFYTGIGEDLYSPRTSPDFYDYWKTQFFKPNISEYTSYWNYWHFLGMVTCDKKIKEPVIKTILGLARQHNFTLDRKQLVPGVSLPVSDHKPEK